MMHWFTPAWIVQTLIASSLLMALVLAVRAPVMRMFGARIAYALWLLPALRMVLPPLPGHRTLMIPVAALKPHEATFGLVDPVHAATMVATAADPHPLPPELVVQYAPMDPPPLEMHQVAHLPPPPPPLGVPPHPIDWTTLALAIWLGGALLLFVTQLVRYRLFLNVALKGSFRMARECGIDVLISEHVPGPIAAGIFKRRILLPGNFVSRYSSEERRLALRHEAAHHDRLDIPANLLALGIVALHWWNPLAHRAYRAFRADQELACDATVLGDADAAERHSYGSAMLKSASGHMPAMACALSHKDQLKKRILMMATAKFGPFRLFTGAALTATAIGGGLPRPLRRRSRLRPASPPPIARLPARPRNALANPPSKPARPAVRPRSLGARRGVKRLWPAAKPPVRAAFRTSRSAGSTKRSVPRCPIPPSSSARRWTVPGPACAPPAISRA